MKVFIDKHKTKLHIFLAVWGFFSGCKILLTFFGKPNGLEAKYPLFFLTISLVSFYVIPMIFLIRYLVKRFDISKKVVHLSWVLGITGSYNFSGIGQTLFGAFGCWWSSHLSPSLMPGEPLSPLPSMKKLAKVWLFFWSCSCSNSSI